MRVQPVSAMPHIRPFGMGSMGRLLGVVYPFFAGHMASGEVGDADDLWPSAVPAVASSAFRILVYAQQAHPLSLVTRHLIFDDSDDESDDEDEDVLKVLSSHSGGFDTR